MRMSYKRWQIKILMWSLNIVIGISILAIAWMVIWMANIAVQFIVTLIDKI